MRFLIAASAIAISAAAVTTAAVTVNSANSAAVAASISANDASRLAKQAAFGPTPALIDHIVATGSAQAWIDEQLGLKTSSYADLAAKPVPTTFCNGTSGQAQINCNRDNFQVTPVAMRFYSNAAQGDDQLRQRVAFALSQIVVASDLEVHTTAGLATFNQIFLDNAFGNYRDILAAATLSPFMGAYLNLADSSNAAPNENYARELMQLFSIGVVALNADGTPKLDANGAQVDSYGPNDVKDVARALTGWTYARLSSAAITDDTKRDYSKPMVAVPARFDTGAKTFLGVTVPASATQQKNVDTVVDTLFNHPNIAPFVSKRLIQQLVMSNPSPAYVGRVSAVFANNGAGVRGDLKAVVRAILLDPEARNAAANPGKVKEPVLLSVSLTRAIGVKTDGFAYMTRDAMLGQQPFRAPSVFNFAPYDYPLPLGGALVSPNSKLMNVSSLLSRHNLVFDWTINGEPNIAEFQPQASITGATGTQLNWAQWEAFGGDETKILDRVNLLMFNGTMTADQRKLISNAITAVKNSDPTTQARKRAQVALYVAGSSPFFQVDR